MKRYTLKELREKARMTQKEVATVANIKVNYLSMLENGHRNPSDNLKKKLASIYKCNVADIFLALETTKCCTNNGGTYGRVD